MPLKAGWVEKWWWVVSGTALLISSTRLKAWACFSSCRCHWRGKSSPWRRGESLGGGSGSRAWTEHLRIALTGRGGSSERLGGGSHCHVLGEAASRFEKKRPAVSMTGRLEAGRFGVRGARRRPKEKEREEGG